jgi:hypothetical protein
MRRATVLAGLVVLALAGCDAPTDSSSSGASTPTSPSFKAVTTTQNEQFFAEQAVFVSCANGGLGELVILSGSLHSVFHSVVNDAGQAIIRTHFQPQGVRGVGEITGTKYQGVGVTEDVLHLKVGSDETFINNFRVIGQGAGNNFMVHENLHLRIDGTGTVTASFDNLRTDCS